MRKTLLYISGAAYKNENIFHIFRLDIYLDILDHAPGALQRRHDAQTRGGACPTPFGGRVGVTRGAGVGVAGGGGGGAG